MSGSKIGGRKAAATNKAKHGEQFYEVIGKLGGQASYGYPFAHGALDPSETGKKGGRPRKDRFLIVDEPSTEIRTSRWRGFKWL